MNNFNVNDNSNINKINIGMSDNSSINNNYNINNSLQIKGANINSGKENRTSITPPNNNQRSFSYDQKDKNQNSTGLNNPKKDVMKIIISPQVQNVYNQNVNNIYIQNPQFDLNFDKNKPNQNIVNSNNPLRNNFNSNENSEGSNYPLYNRPNSVNKKDYNMSMNSDIVKQPIRNDYNNNLNDRINRNFDNQKYMYNNYLSNQNVLE